MKKIALFLMAAIAVISCKPEEEAIVPEVTVNTAEETLVIPTAGGEAVISFTTNVDWTANIAETVDWCTLTPSTGKAGEVTVKLIAQKNETNDNRIATVVITAQDVVKQVKVTQLQKNALVLSGESAFEVPAEGGEVKFTVSANVTLTATPDVDWIVATKAMQNTEYSFTVAANDGAARSGKIVVTDGKLTEEVTVSQAAWVPVFEVSPAEDQWLAIAGGTVELNVNANVEYEVTMDENDWLTLAGENGAYTLTAGENPAFDYRAVGVYVTPKDEAFVDSAVAFYVFQNGHAALSWTKVPTVDYTGYEAGSPTRLAMYGDYLLLANLNKVFAINPADGTVAKTYELPEGLVCQSLCVDEGGNVIISNSPSYSWDGPEACEILYVYVLKSFDSEPELLINYSTANIWGATTGNLRVAGNISDKAIVTAVAGGAAYWVAWEVSEGKVAQDANGWSVFQCGTTPYAFSDSFFACAVPAGPSLADGLWYMGYGGNYDLQYCANPSENAWASVVSSDNNGNWNNSAMDFVSFGGADYAILMSGAHFNYADPYLLLCDITDKTAAKTIYKLDLGQFAERNEDWSLVNWTGAGAHSDVLVVETEAGFNVYFADGNFNMIGCVAIQ